MQGRSNAAAEAVVSLPELLREILLRLPAKSLLNFKSVCRQWYDLISCPKFRLEHTRRNPNPRPAGMFLSRWISKIVTSYVEFDNLKVQYMSPATFPKGLKIRSSCNGLLLFSSGEPHADSGLKLYVCNPATKQVVRVPILKTKLVCSPILAFDPSTPESFRLVCVSATSWFQLPHPQLSVDVYESEIGAWRHSNTFPNQRVIVFSNGVFWNGSAYWFNSKEETLISFDLKQDRFRTPLSLRMIGKGRTFFFGECQGHLYLLRGYRGCNPVLLNLYEMEQDHSHLSVKCSIRNHDLVSFLNPLDLSMVLHIFLGQEDELFLVVSCEKEIRVYNAKIPNSAPTKILRFSCALNPELLHHYTDSLVPV